MTTPDPTTAGHDLARLRIRLSTLLAAAEDLAEEWEATVELAKHLRSQRQQAGRECSTAVVLVDLEALMRARPRSRQLRTGAAPWSSCDRRSRKPSAPTRSYCANTSTTQATTSTPTRQDIVTSNPLPPLVIVTRKQSVPA